MQKVRLFCYLLLCFSVPLTVYSKGVYQEPADFIDEVFNGNPPEPDKLWLRGELKENIREILGHDMDVLRLRYWLKDGRSVWILEEIGKERLITSGFVINEGSIEKVKVLVFRETRGWEVRYPFFTDQFKGAKLDEKKLLDRHIDGISGATLSVNALTRLAQLALFLHSVVTQTGKD